MRMPNITKNLVLLWLASAPLPDGVVSGHRDLFLREAPPKWEIFVNKTAKKNLQGLIKMYAYDKAKKAFTPDGEMVIKQRERCALFLDPGDSKGRGILDVKNGEYGFTLRRANADAPWILISTDLNLSDGLSLPHYDPDELVGMYINCPLTIWHFEDFLPKVVRDNPTGVGTVSPVTKNGEKLYRVEFTDWVTEKPRELRAGVPINGWILVDPQRYWLMRECGFHLRWHDGRKGLAERELHYTDRDGFPFLTHSVLKLHWPDGEGQVKIEFSLEEVDVPEREFYLSGYGFPEPQLARGLSWWLYAGIIGIALIGLSLFVRRRWSRA